MSPTTWLQNHSQPGNDISADVAKMINEAGNTCVSIIVPTHRLGQDRHRDRIELQSATDHSENIVTSIRDNYKGASIHDLALLAWLQIRAFLDRKKINLVNEFAEKVGKGLRVCGVQDVWTAAHEGRGLVLLVEKNYGRAAFVASDNKLYLQRPKLEAVRYSDVINEIMTTVLRKNGKVMIVEKDTLKNFETVALILRY